MEHWIKYKDNILNIAGCRGFRIEKMMSKRNQNDAIAWTGDLKPTDDKRWMLFLDHEGIEVFKTKDEAVQLAEQIVKGKYDI